VIVIVSTKKFDKSFENLNKIDQERITEKLEYLKCHPNIFTIVKKTENLDPGTHRLRIGNMRILLRIEEKTNKELLIILLKVAHRREIYK